MITFFRFVPSNRQAPVISPVFDGNVYNIKIVWNLSAQRYYVECRAVNSDLIYSVPVVASINPVEIENLIWDQLHQRVVLTTAEPHGLRIGKVINITVLNCIPVMYNGAGLGYPISETEIVYPMLSNPGTATTFGALDIHINMNKGYFSSTLVNRNSNFEVSP